MEKFVNVVRIGFKVFAAVAAGYFVHQCINEKADELVQDGGVVNAIMIGAGEGALIVVASTLTYYIYG